MRTTIHRMAAAALAGLLALGAGGCGGSDSAPAGDPPPGDDAPPVSRPPPTDGAFGVFAAFAPEFPSFWTSLGLDYAGYQDWAGGQLSDLGATWTRSNLQLVWDLVEPVPGAGFDWTASFAGDAPFDAATRNGVRYLAVFHEGGGGGQGKQPLRDPVDDLEAYARFVEAEGTPTESNAARTIGRTAD